jgi:fibrillarin-like pre-rRNA processing protein
MKQSNIIGIFTHNNQFFTINPDHCRGIKVYNERLFIYKDREYRSWNPYRSKIVAAISNGLKIMLDSNFNLLYLGAATGTTVSHFSDILKNGIVFAIENSPISMKKLLNVCDIRKNIIPILEDAYHPERYYSTVPRVDFIYQDISQRNQAEIFEENIKRYLKPKHKAVLMVKARSIDVSLSPKKSYEIVLRKLLDSGFIINQIIDLKPFEKDHVAISIKNK